MSIVVVGAGISGLSIALNLLEQGLGPVTVVERTGIGAGASGIQPGGVRRQWATRGNCLMASESYAFYRDFAERFDTRAQARFDTCGYVFLADTETTLAGLEAAVALQHDLGIPSVLLSPEEAATVVPGLEPDGLLGGATCAEDGYFDRPQAVVEAFAEVVAARGGTIEIAEVRAIERDGDGWRLAGLTADAVVVAAGTASRALLAPLGFDLPIVEEPRTLFLSEPIRERLLEPLVIAVDRGIAAKQLADGRVLASDLRAAVRSRLREELDRLLPVLRYVSLPIVATGMYDMTPDGQPIIDRLDDGLWVAAGFSGHGFMVAPSTGRAVADGLAGAPPPEWLDALRADRFGARLDEHESQVI
ncbi:MAG TPA: FAD-binding oxidoreductase [Gaiellaceae bacterium]|jgi:sarcosine oxidase subunit beta|nr:FAD-binding oxidoreductase [Gaiellaceae bacterium]